MSEIIKPGIVLMIIALLSAVSLAYINSITEPLIKQRKLAQVDSSLLELLPSADEFVEEDYAYSAYSNGLFIGKILKVNAPGYSSVMEVLVGTDLDNKITGVKVLYQEETPGLGAKVETNEFLDQFLGKDKRSVKLKRDGGQIDAITGATISSRAISNGISQAIENG